MNKQDVLRHFGGVSATARALGIGRSAVSQWPELIPEGRAWQVEAVTRRKLRVDPSDYIRSRTAAA